MPDTFTKASLEAVAGGNTNVIIRDYFPLNETSNNRISLTSARVFTPTSGTVNTTTGLFGTCATFTGGVAGVLRTPVSYPLGSGPFTFLIWVKPKSTDVKIPECTIFQGSGFAVNISTWNPAAAEGLRAFAITSVGERAPAINAQLMVKDQWNLIGLYFKQGERMRCYINGTLSPDSVTGTSPLINIDEVLNNAQITIGGVNAVSGHTTGMDIGPVMVFNDLSEGQMDYLYNNGLGRSLSVMSMSAAPTQIGTGVSTQTIVLTGNETTWDAGAPPVVTVSGVTGVSLIQRVVNSPTSMTVTVATGNTTGTLTVTDVTNNLSTTVEVVSLDPNILPVYPRSEGYWPASQTAGGGTSAAIVSGTEATCRGFAYVAPDLVAMGANTMIEMVFSNHTTKSVTYTISVQRQPGDVPTRLTFGGQNTIIVPAGAFFKSDPFQIGTLGSDRAIPTISRLQWSGSGLSIATYTSSSLRVRVGQPQGWNFNTTTDVTLNDAAFVAGVDTNITYNCWTACAVNAEGYVGPYVIVLGDSLSNSYSRQPGGLITAALDDVAYYNMSAGGDASSNWFVPGTATFLGTTAMALGYKIALAFFPVSTVKVFGYGHNDIFNGVDPTLYLNRAKAFFERSDLFALNGGPTSGKRIQWTLTPKTTKESGASWATITDAQQTPFEGSVSGGSVNAVIVNTQLFATPTAWGATALLDLATLSRSPNASGLFWDDGDKTPDGTHLGVGMIPGSTLLANLGPWTSRILPSTPSGVPTLIISFVAGVIRVTRGGAVTGATGFKLERIISGIPSTLTTSMGATYDDTGYTGNLVQSYRVTPYNSTGNGASTVVSFGENEVSSGTIKLVPGTTQTLSFGQVIALGTAGEKRTVDVIHGSITVYANAASANSTQGGITQSRGEQKYELTDSAVIVGGENGTVVTISNNTA